MNGMEYFRAWYNRTPEVSDGLKSEKLGSKKDLSEQRGLLTYF